MLNLVPHIFTLLKHACAKFYRDCSYSASWRSSVNLENMVSKKTLWKYLCHGERNRWLPDQNQKVKFLRLHPQKYYLRKDNPFTIRFFNEERDSCGNQFPRWAEFSGIPQHSLRRPITSLILRTATQIFLREFLKCISVR